MCYITLNITIQQQLLSKRDYECHYLLSDTKVIYLPIISCTQKPFCMHVTCMLVAVRTICQAMIFVSISAKRRKLIIIYVKLKIWIGRIKFCFINTDNICRSLMTNFPKIYILLYFQNDLYLR